MAEESSFSGEEIRDIRFYGGVGDGIADDSPAFAKAFADPVLRTLRLPAGTWRLTDFQVVPSRVRVTYDNGAAVPGRRLIDAGRVAYRFDGIAAGPGRVPPTPEFAAAGKYAFDLVFHLPDTGNMQGLAFYDGFYYVGFDVGGGNGVIRQYSAAGVKVRETPAIPIGHAADLAYRVADGRVYVANGGGTSPTHVYAVDMATGAVVRDIDLSALGNAGLLAIDNARDLMLVHTAPSDTGDPTFTLADFTGAVLHSFALPNQGVPQGLAIAQDQIYFYTDNKITVLDHAGGILGVIPVPKSGESEGIAVSGDGWTPSLTVGYNAPNRLYALRSVENQVGYHAFGPASPVNLRTDGSVPLMPRIATFALNTNAGTGQWRPVEWDNGYNLNAIVAAVETGATEIKVTLRQPFKSIGYFDVAPNFNLNAAGYTAGLDVSGANAWIRFYDRNGGAVDPRGIAAYRTVKVVIVGGVSVDD